MKMMNYFKRFTGERIYLSPVSGSDEEAVQRTKWSNDLYTPIYVGGGTRVTTLSSMKGHADTSGAKYHSFAIVLKNTDEMIGTVSFNGLNNINRSANLTISIGNKDYWSKGYGTEAIILLLDFGFNNLNLLNVGLLVYGFNVRGYKCYLKCGFKEYARRRKCIIVGQKRYDFICMDMHAEDYYELHNKSNQLKSGRE